MYKIKTYTEFFLEGVPEIHMCHDMRKLFYSIKMQLLPCCETKYDRLWQYTLACQLVHLVTARCRV